MSTMLIVCSPVLWLRYGGRALALTWATFWTLFGLLSGIGEGADALGVFLHTLMPGLILLAAAIIAWRWQAVGAVLLFLGGLATLALFPWARTVMGLVMLPLPGVLAGALLLAARMLTRRATHADEPG